MRLTTLFAAIIAVAMSGYLAVGGEPPPAPWLPHESWSEGKQYDPRLERTVKLWGAGMPLRAAFDRVKEQTGVVIGFLPADDDNARICVNLYLDPDQPPTLRELMVQLSWTLDCAFGYLGEGEDKTYLLLSTSLGQEVEGLLSAEREAEHRRDRELSEQIRDRLPARRRELREALGLTREEAIRRYRGKDDLLLYASLDPTRRAIAEFYLSLPESVDRLASGLPITNCRLSALEKRQRALLWEATREPLRELETRLKAAGHPREAHPDDLAWLESVDPNVIAWLNVHPDEVTVDISFGPSLRGNMFDLGLPGLMLFGQPIEEDELELRRLQGETIGPGDTERVLNEIRRQRKEAKIRQLIEEQRESARLSQRTSDLLAATKLPVSSRSAYALWQIQEAVARRTGLSIISDCFYQPERKLSGNIALLSAESQPDTALALLQKSTIAPENRHMLRSFVLAQPETVSWEWKNAGRFLVFRSRDRDVWRGAFLPADTVRKLEQWAEPYLRNCPPDKPAEWPREIAPDWRALGRITAGLNSAQMKWGAVLTYGDPTDPRRAYLQGLLTAAMEMACQQAYALRFIGALSESQWQQLQAEGLRVGSDIPLRRAVELLHLGPESGPEWWMARSTLRTDADPGGWLGLEEGDVLQLRAGSGPRPPYAPGPVQSLVLVRGRSSLPIAHTPDSITIRPRATESLPAPAVAGPPSSE